jgi:hypothetical protein
MGPIRCSKRRKRITIWRCVIPHRGGDLVTIAADAWNHGFYERLQRFVHFHIFLHGVHRDYIFTDDTSHVLQTGCCSHSYYLPRFDHTNNIWCRSQWPRGLRPRSAAERLLGSWVRVSPGAWMFVSFECLCCQVEVSATGRSLVQRSPTDCGVCLSVITKPRERGWPWPETGRKQPPNKKYLVRITPYESLHHARSSTLLLLPPFWIQIFSSVFVLEHSQATFFLENAR